VDTMCSEDASECTNSFKVMQDELRRINALVESYVRLGKVPTSHEKKVLSIEQVIDEAVLLFFNKAEMAGVRLEKNYSDTLPVLIDRGQMREVFLNLSNNAIEAMDKGGVLLFETGNSNGVVKIMVKDTGAGIDEETMKDLFVPFKTTKSTGLGLGLNITEHLIAEHDGKLLCESVKGEGTTFTILLPVYEEVKS